jgi:DNA-binding MarR family transcriptional regulator
MDDPLLRLDDFRPYRLSVVANLVSDVIAKAYAAAFDLTIPQWRVIAAVAETDGTTQQQIGQRTRMDKVTVSRAAIALVQRGVLQRASNEHDRRSHRLTLSPHGRALYAEVVPKALELEARIFGKIDPELLAAIDPALRAIEAAAQEILGSTASQ